MEKNKTTLDRCVVVNFSLSFNHTVYTRAVTGARSIGYLIDSRIAGWQIDTPTTYKMYKVELICVINKRCTSAGTVVRR